MQGSVAIDHLRHDPRSGYTFAIDSSAGRVHLIDELMGHSSEVLCLDPSEILEDPAPQYQEGCNAGEISLHRGFVKADDVVDVAVDREGQQAWVVTADGQLISVEMSLARGDALGWLRASEPIETDLEVTSAVWSDGLWLATPDQVVQVEGSAVVDSLDVLGATLVSGEEGLWIHSEDSLYLPTGKMVNATLVSASMGLAAWWDDGRLLSSEGLSVEVPEQPTALSIDGKSGVIWTLGSGHLTRYQDEDIKSVKEAGTGLMVTPTHDVMVIDESVVRVYYDEESLISGDPPIELVGVTALESPNSTKQLIRCTGSGSIGSKLTMAAANREVMELLPGVMGVAVSARFAEGVHHCSEYDAFGPWLDGRFELGLMLHQNTDCEDGDCYIDTIEERSAQVLTLGVRPTFGTSYDGGEFNWVQALRDFGIDRYLLFGASIHPDLSIEDNRAKQGWPLQPGDGPAVLSVSSVDDICDRDPVPSWLPALGFGCSAPVSSISLHPGLSRAAFTMDGCDSLLYIECALLERNSKTYDDVDMKAIGLAARHAVARRGDGPSSFTWHLADINLYDYVDGCSITAGELVGECEGQYLLQLTNDLDQTLVSNGLAVWANPSQLSAPIQ